MVSLRRWVLSRQCQLTVQLSCSLLVSSLFTLWSPIHFSHACLVPVFVIVIVGSLAYDQHIGTRLQVCAWMLGPSWVATISAGSLMSLAKLAAWGQPQYVAATAVLAMLGLALLIFLQTVAPPGPGRVMGIIAVLIYGIMVVLSTLYHDLSSMWVNAVLTVVLGVAIATVIAMLVGFLVMPSLASDEVWRLTSEALQGAGAVLSYHTSLLMVDVASAADKAGPTLSAANMAQASKHDSSGKHQRQAARHKQHQLQHQHQQHHQLRDWRLHHAAQHGHPTCRSSIEVAAAGAAVVAASQDAHKPAAEAAAVALSWVDTADEALSAAHSGEQPRVSGARSEASSSGDSIASIVGSDAVADAAAEYSKRFHAAQQDGQSEEGEQQAAREPRLSEQLLQQVEEEQRQQQQQQQGPLSVGTGHSGVVDAWVCASAALAAVSARPSLDGSASVSFSSSMGLTPVLLAASPSQRRSLEGAASLDFMEEMDDKAFIAMMRVISQSKGGSATRPAAADTAAMPSATASSTAQNAAGKGGSKGLPLSKSLGALSALSVQGSTTAPEDWAGAVLPHTAEVPAQPNSAAPSVAGSVLSSHASVLHPAGRHAQHQHQPSRFLTHQQLQKQPAPQPQQPGSFSKRQSLGARAWSFLTIGSMAGSITAAKSSSALSNPPPASEGKLTAASARSSSPPAADADTDAGVEATPPLLPAPTTSAQLQPLIGRAKAVLASARLEPWWLRPKSHQHLDADACMKLLDDCELLLVRLSTLEGVSEERSLMGLQLHQLAHYKGIADALALIVAQLTAFIMHVATAVAMQETTSQHCHTPWRPHWLKRSPAGAASKKQQQLQGKPTAVVAGVTAPSRLVQRMSPFAGAPAAEVGNGADADATSMGMSTLLSIMERQGSGVSSYLWETKTGWGQAREMLKREMDASLGGYWWSVRKASKQLPVKVPRSREVMVLIFLWPICNGLLEACERVEASAQQVLRPAGTHHSTSTSSKHHPHASTAVSWPSVLQAWQWLRSQGVSRKGVLHPTAPSRGATGSMKNPPGQKQGQGTMVRCMARVQSRVAACWSWVRRQGQWASPLFQLVLVKPALLAVHQAVTQDVHKALSSKQGFQQLLASRTFQSGVKLLLSTGAVLLATILLMAYIPAVAHSVPIFGYAAVVLCFQPRVEATVDQAARRVFGTILGACLGLATNSVPHIFHEPLLLLACLAVASVVLGVLARPQRRTAIVLALLTLCAVSLCGYEAACCSARGGMKPFETFLARMGSVCGACVFVALFNRLVLPWFTSDYALEQLADALEQAALLFSQIYNSQLERMRLAELVAGQIKQQGGTGVTPVPDALQVHIDAAPAVPESPCPTPAAAPAADDPPPAAAGRQEAATAAGGGAGVQSGADPAAALAACEASEAQLLVVLRQQVLSRLVAVQLALAKESVSWKRGVLATPQLVLNVLGAMNAVKEALTSQRLALAPFTRQGAASMQEQKGGGSGMLHMMEHCYSMWALPLHPVWMQIMHTVQELTATTAAHLRRRPQGPAARAAARAQLTAKLEQLESQRLDLRHGWLELRMRLHRAVRDGQPMGGRVGAVAGEGACFWPTDSVHLFTFTYGVSRCLNAFAAAAQAVAHGLED